MYAAWSTIAPMLAWASRSGNSATRRAVPPAIAMFEGADSFAIPWEWITAASAW